MNVEFDVFDTQATQVTVNFKELFVDDEPDTTNTNIECCSHELNKQTIDPSGFIVCSCSTILGESYQHAKHVGSDSFGEINRYGPVQKNSQLGTIPAGTWRDRRKLTAMMVSSSHDKSIAKYHGIIEMRCTGHDIPNNVIDEAKDYYTSLDNYKRRNKNQRKEGVIRGNRLIGVLAACVLQATEKKAAEHMEQISLTEAKVSNIFGVDKEYVSQGIKDLKKILFKQTPTVLKTNHSPLEVKKMRIANFIQTFSHQMTGKSRSSVEKMPPAYVRAAIHVSNQLLDLKITTKCTPTSTAATSITLVKLCYDLPVKRNEISDVCDVSDVTINKILKTLRVVFSKRGAKQKTPMNSSIYSILFPDIQQIDEWEQECKGNMKAFKSEIIAV